MNNELVERCMYELAEGFGFVPESPKNPGDGESNYVVNFRESNGEVHRWSDGSLTEGGAFISSRESELGFLLSNQDEGNLVRIQMGYDETTQQVQFCAYCYSYVPKTDDEYLVPSMVIVGKSSDGMMDLSVYEQDRVEEVFRKNNLPYLAYPPVNFVEKIVSNGGVEPSEQSKVSITELSNEVVSRFSKEKTHNSI